MHVTPVDTASFMRQEAAELWALQLRDSAELNLSLARDTAQLAAKASHAHDPSDPVGTIAAAAVHYRGIRGWSYVGACVAGRARVATACAGLAAGGLCNDAADSSSMCWMLCYDCSPRRWSARPAAMVARFRGRLRLPAWHGAACTSWSSSTLLCSCGSARCWYGWQCSRAVLQPSQSWTRRPWSPSPFPLWAQWMLTRAVRCCCPTCQHPQCWRMPPPRGYRKWIRPAARWPVALPSSRSQQGAHINTAPSTFSKQRVRPLRARHARRARSWPRAAACSASCGVSKSGACRLAICRHGPIALSLLTSAILLLCNWFVMHRWAKHEAALQAKMAVTLASKVSLSLSLVRTHAFPLTVRMLPLQACGTTSLLFAVLTISIKPTWRYHPSGRCQPNCQALRAQLAAAERKARQDAAQRAALQAQVRFCQINTVCQPRSHIDQPSRAPKPDRRWQVLLAFLLSHAACISLQVYFFVVLTAA